MTRATLFKTQISSGSYRDFIGNIMGLSETRPSSYVCFANVHMITTCYRDEKFNQVVNGADIVAPDGKPIAVWLRLFNRLKQPKISGPDIFPDLLKEAALRQKKVFFYGSTEAVLQKITARAAMEFPALKIAGYYAPPFHDPTPREEMAINILINALSPDLMFVALGCPKQEKYMASHVGKINTCMLGMGQAFRIYAGEIERAPRWMQHAGLEWAHRLWTEPGRLWKRYAYTNTLFLFITLRHMILSLVRKRSFQNTQTL
ncbi:WecB/TagA/CpsF family glycosyltransferase [Fulvivirgaceae bacterium PWU4]|uniref:WecB/TagA/CpsF family glycosyltransferase n=1 Tax=Chryseosolibacter histidini TaxID=2782349 RepID=A0AAP2DPX9_9BACT|nr:WecB/TagA/CpsF family glycosyltransferase [Chryseosolibacter histidini]MBT1700353.1 WecB/TagA/CpsF family glycosyltransferase [Chryseosolibacter histidini]